MGFSWKCGVPAINQSLVFNSYGKIIHVEDAISNSWPWMVSLRISLNDSLLHNCGGSILDETTILTAAHCVTEPVLSLFVVVGAHDIDGSFKNDSIYGISNAYIHPNYNESELRSDIAILKLNKPISFSSKVYPVCLPNSSNMSVVYDKKVVVIGWSFVSNDTSFRMVLQNAILRVTTNSSICSALDDYNPKENYCLIEDTSSLDTDLCYGDSGGPMIYFDGEKWILYGVASFVVEWINDKNDTACLTDYPSYYTSVPFFLNYIQSYVVQNISTSVKPSAIIFISIFFRFFL